MSRGQEHSRRAYLLGLLVYFPELKDLGLGSRVDTDCSPELKSLLEPGDEEILEEISEDSILAAREAVSRRFATDYPIGF